jgi:hypothetical protein
MVFLLGLRSADNDQPTCSLGALLDNAGLLRGAIPIFHALDRISIVAVEGAFWHAGPSRGFWARPPLLWVSLVKGLTIKMPLTFL